MFWSKQFKPTAWYSTKKGFLVPNNGGPMTDAILYLYSNGIRIVKEDDRWPLEAFAKSPSTYEVNSSRFSKFIVTE